MFNIYSLISMMLLLTTFIKSEEWPVPYKRFKSRPKNDPYCSALYTFCPTGLADNTMPSFDPDDKIDVFALKAPVWEFKYGALMKHFNIMHDAIGFRSHKTGINYTMEWYELDQLFNCTFPHLLENNVLKWCNQGAACIYQGIDDIHWSQNGTLVKVAEMSGIQFKQFSDWALWDNATGIFYETWSVLDKPNGNYWFESHDCATFVLNTFQKLGEIGVKFNKSINLQYTRINLYSYEPKQLGNISYIQKHLPFTYKDMIKFYKNFQPHLGFLRTLENSFKVLLDVILLKKFYFFYNYEYWYLEMKHPYVKLVNPTIPLP